MAMSEQQSDKSRVVHAKRIALDCYKGARAMLGHGWDHVSADVQYALVAERVLGILLNQDESVDSRSAIELTRIVAREAYALVHCK